MLEGLAAAARRRGRRGARRPAADLLGLPVALRDPDLRVRAWAAPPGLRLTTAPSLPPAVARRAGPATRWSGSAGPAVGGPAAGPALGVAGATWSRSSSSTGEPAGYLDVGEMGRPLGPRTRRRRQAAAALSLLLLADVRAARGRPHPRRRARRPGPGSPGRPTSAGSPPGSVLDLDRPTCWSGSRSPRAVRPPTAGGVTAALRRAGPTPPPAEPDAVVGSSGWRRRRGRRHARGPRAPPRGPGPVAAAPGSPGRRVRGRPGPRGFPAALAATQEVDGIVAALGGPPRSSPSTS